MKNVNFPEVTILYKLPEFENPLVFYPFENFGCYLALYDGVIFKCSMLTGGLPNLFYFEDDEYHDCVHEITDPASQEFLDEVNEHFKTEFQLEQF